MKRVDRVSKCNLTKHVAIDRVFPAEACETIGGEACLADIYPEVKLNPEAQINTEMQAAEAFEREYLEYSGPKT